MKKGILATITCVILTILCGCEEIENVNEGFSSELSNIIMSYQSEPQTQSEEPEAVREMTEVYYSYHNLNETEQMLYLEIFDALTAMSEEKRISTLDSEQLDRIFECVLNDHPELFYVEGFKYTEHFFGDTLTGISFVGSYSMTKEEAESALAEIEQSLSDCMSEVPLNEDEYSTVKYLYEYLIDNTEYDKDADNNQNIRSVFLGHRSVCQGYAKAMQYMLQKVGIQSFLVTGYTGAERHAWNLVRVNGKYYYLDPTWGDASYSYGGNEDTENEVFLPPINYDYFLVTTSEIAKTHSFEDLVMLPACDSTEDNYYVREGLYFEQYDRQQLENIFDSEAVKQEDYVTLKCADSQVYQEMLSEIIDERQIFGIIKNNEGAISYASNEELCTISFWNIFY
ncbi:MAG: hypothetical protein HDR25_03810 [Lachnospiraceae bacterium]|nr:hypothetical protein [Lachnospiraceae bacterium]